MATISLHSPACMAGITRVTAILATPSTPHRTFFMTSAIVAWRRGGAGGGTGAPARSGGVGVGAGGVSGASRRSSEGRWGRGRHQKLSYRRWKVPHRRRLSDRHKAPIGRSSDARGDDGNVRGRGFSYLESVAGSLAPLFG